MVEKHAARIDHVLLARPSVSWKSGGNEVWDRYSSKDGGPRTAPVSRRPRRAAVV